MNIILKDIFDFNMNEKEQKEGSFFYVNEVFKQNGRFKIVHGVDKVNLGRLFCIVEDERTRKHSLCLKIRRNGNSNIRLKFFTIRVINY